MAKIRPSQIRQSGAITGQVLVWNGLIWAATTVVGVGGNTTPAFAALDKYRTD